MIRLLQQITRIPGAIGLWKRMALGRPSLRVSFGVWARPHYAYGVYHAALQAKRLGLPGITAVELGVAGGNGLLALENHAAEIAAETGMQIDVYGFDGGGGMPAPQDYRDLPHVWDQGFYQMDERKLRARLSTAQLVIGDVGETLPAHATQFRHPVGFIAFDLDYYSSTKRALALFDAPHDSRLPRVYCYMDDVMWPEHALHCQWIGELCAIREFNEEHDHQKIEPIANLRWMRLHEASWNNQFYAHHDFSHPRYTLNLTQAGAAHREKPLQA